MRDTGTEVTAGRLRTEVFLPLVVAAWLVVVGAGFGAVLAYASAPGDPAAAPETWPAGTALARPGDVPTLLLFIHPHCPCSRATISELAVLLARVGDRARCTVLFERPAGVPEGWERTALWDRAAAIPRVTVLADVDGAEARRFGARTSGQVCLYDAKGALAFRGGITAARGHEGDNAGRDRLESLLLTGRSLGDRSQVYGCLLEAEGGR